MVKEKHKWYISIVSMILAIIVVISLMFINSKNKTATQNAKTTLETVLDKNSIMEVNIDIDETDWEWLIKNAAEEEYRSADVTINGETYYNVGIRPKGNSSLKNVPSSNSPERYSFKIKFDEYMDGQTYNGIKSIVVNNIIQDNTYMKEYIAYDLFSFLDVATPEMSYSNIKVNNEEWGLYLALEVIDERYLESNFGKTEGNLYKPETMDINVGNAGGGRNFQVRNENGKGLGAGDHNYMNEMKEHEEQIPNTDNIPKGQENPQEQGNRENMQNKALNQGGIGGGFGGGKNSGGADFVYIDDEVSSYSTVRDSAVKKSTTDEDFKKVINMYKNLDEGTNLDEVLDVNEVLKYFAVNTFLINLDSYSGEMYHNYYLYERNGKIQMLPWDLNLAFGGMAAKVRSGSSNIINFPIDNPVTGNLKNMPLIGQLLEVDEYKELYHSYLKQIADEYFNSGYYSNLVNNIDTLINDYVKEDPTAFCTYDEYEAAVDEMIKFGEDRTESVLAQLNGEQPSTTYGDLASTVNISALGDMGGGKPKNTNQTTKINETNGAFNSWSTE